MIQENKIMSLADGKVLYDDLRERVDEKYTKPQNGIPASDLASGVIPSAPVQDVQVNGTSILDAQGVANIPYASTSNAGIAKQIATNSVVKAGSNDEQPITPSRQHMAAFYGIARAAGDTTQSQSSNAVGTYTETAKSAIQQMLGVSNLLAPRETSYIASQAYAVGDIFTLNGKLYKVTTAIAESGAIVVQNDGETVGGANAVQCRLGEETIKDVQVNGVSVLQDGVANVPIADRTVAGAVKLANDYGIQRGTGGLLEYAVIAPAESSKIKAADTSTKATYQPITPRWQHESTFYGLAKAAGDTTQSQSDNAVGTYTDNAKDAIQQMFGIDSLIATHDTSTATAAHAIGEVFIMNSKLYRATSAIAIGDTITAGTNCEAVKVSEVFTRDVKVNGTSVVNNGVADIPVANDIDILGVVKAHVGYGTHINNSGALIIQNATSEHIKGSTGSYRPITPSQQDASTFYGLAKASGDTTQSASSNAVGTYTDNAKASIKSMLGIVDGSTSTVSIIGTTPSITAVENTRYTCGEVGTLTITPPASGICIVRFTSGTTPTVLTATGVVWPAWFDATDLEANTTYEICITDGYGAVMSWAL